LDRLIPLERLCLTNFLDSDKLFVAKRCGLEILQWRCGIGEIGFCGAMPSSENPNRMERSIDPIPLWFGVSVVPSLAQGIEPG
jgi:hypothetical protein